MSYVDIEISKAKQHTKELKKLKKMERKLRRTERILYKPHPYFVFMKLVGVFIDLVRKETE